MAGSENFSLGRRQSNFCGSRTDTQITQCQSQGSLRTVINIFQHLLGITQQQALVHIEGCLVQFQSISHGGIDFHIEPAVNALHQKLHGIVVDNPHRCDTQQHKHDHHARHESRTCSISPIVAQQSCQIHGYHNGQRHQTDDNEHQQGDEPATQIFRTQYRATEQMQGKQQQQ